MSRRFTVITLVLTAVVAFLVGASGVGRSDVSAGQSRAKPGVVRAVHTGDPAPGAGLTGLVNFADVVARINPAVVNIDATTRGRENRRRRGGRVGDGVEPPVDGPLEFGPRGDAPHRGAGSGFIIDADGSILT